MSPIQVNIYQNSSFAFSTELSSSLELGRQDADDGPPYSRNGDRVIIAADDERAISRRHVTLTLQPDGSIRVANESGVNSIFIDGAPIRPGQQRDAKLHDKITVGEKLIRLEPIETEIPVAAILDGLKHQAAAPGKSGVHDTIIGEFLATDHSSNDIKYLLRGLHASISAFQLATTSSEFFSTAARTLVDVVGLETAAALVYENGAWKVEALRSRPGSAGERADWEPSQTILSSVRREKRTVWQTPELDASTAASLVDVKALLATPVLDRRGEVIGALYGDRRWNASSGADFGVSEVEAVLVEVLSTSVAAGLARLEQQKAAVEARVLFEQFFSPELARQLEAHPDLLMGKDTEVSILHCDIEGFSGVTEKLGARLTLDWINDVMGTLSDCVVEQHGVLVDTLGDELIGMWGAPAEREDHAALACRAAVRMFEQLAALNRRWKNALDRPVDLAIGIHSGTARVGNIGSSRKFKYGPLGNAVKIAARTLRATKQLLAKVLITEPVVQRLSDEFSVRKIYCLDDAAAPSLDLYQLAADVPDDWPKLKQRYESAWEARRRGDHPTATRLLAAILAEHPGDRPALQLLAQINSELTGENAPV